MLRYTSSASADCTIAMSQFRNGQSAPLDSNSSSTTIITMMEALLNMNSSGVACWRDGREEEALFLFEKGLSTCGVHINEIFGHHHHVDIPTAATRLSSLATSSIHKPCAASFVTPREEDSTSQQHGFLQTIDITQHQTQQQQQPRDNTYELYERALIVDPTGVLPRTCETEEQKQALLLLCNHIAPVMLYNAGLLVHQRAVASADHYWAHELYRMSLFLMEENAMKGMRCKHFDVLLLGLFNNLCELNSSFYQSERVTLCRDKFILVLVGADLSTIRGEDYSFFYEQLRFVIEHSPTAAAAA